MHLVSLNNLTSHALYHIVPAKWTGPGMDSKHNIIPGEIRHAEFSHITSVLCSIQKTNGEINIPVQASRPKK